MAIKKTRNDIINYALGLCGAKAAGEDASADDLVIAAEALDDMVKDFQATGAHLWERDFATVFLNSGVKQYQIGGTTDVRAVPDSNLIQTTVITAITSTTNIIEVSDSTGMVVGQNFGVLTSDNGLQWFTIVAITTTTSPAANIEISATVDSVGENSMVFVYTTGNELGKPLRIPYASSINQLSGVSDFQELEMEQMARFDYENLPNKSSSGRPVQFYFDPKQDFGLLYVWPEPPAETYRLSITYYNPLDVFNDADDAANFPNEWVAALKYNLAVRIAPLFDMPLRQEVIVQAERSLTNALTWDQGDESIYFTYDQYGRG